MSSKWGSYFQQAVAGVESRIDNILAEEEAEDKANASKEDKRKEAQLQRNISTPKTSLGGMLCVFGPCAIRMFSTE